METELIFLQLIKNGEFKIDTDGSVYRLKKGRWIRAEHKTPQGYLQLRKMINGKRYHVGAHRVVWCYFNERAIPDGFTINHKNGIKDFNDPDNLETLTYSDNQKHAHKTGLIDQFGERNPRSKLSNKDVVLIRETYSRCDVTQMQLAKKFGVTFQTISDIVRGKYRKKQGGPVDDYGYMRQRNSTRDPKNGQFV